MTEDELIENLAEKEHASWAHWMTYLFSKCQHNNGAYVITPEYADALKAQMARGYGELTEREKQYDRDEVAHILPIIQEYVEEKIGEFIENLDKPLPMPPPRSSQTITMTCRYEGELKPEPFIKDDDDTPITADTDHGLTLDEASAYMDRISKPLTTEEAELSFDPDDYSLNG